MKKLFLLLIVLLLFSCGGGGGGQPSANISTNNCSFSNNTKGIQGAFVVYPQNLQTYSYKYAVLTPLPFQTAIDTWLDNQTKENFLISHLNKNSYFSLYLGASDWWGQGLYKDAQFIDKQKNLIDEIYSIFGNDIAGIYIPQEMDLCNYSNAVNNYYKELYAYAKQYSYKVMIAPYWSSCSVGSFAYAVQQIKNSADIIAVQDGVGVKHITDLNYLKPYLKQYWCILKDKAWIDLEGFNNVNDMGTTIYQDSNLYKRVQNQIKVDEKYSKHIIVYSNLNLLK